MARSYDNSNRRAAAERTRERIITACAELVSEDRSLDVSIPGVAARAQVSQPTLLRYFPSKQALFDALAARQFHAVTPGLDARSVEDLQTGVGLVFERAAGFEPLIRWTYAALLLADTPTRSRPERLAMLRRAVGAQDPDAPPHAEAEVHRERLLLLTFPLIALFWQDYLGVTAEDAASTAAWAIGRLTSGSHR